MRIGHAVHIWGTRPVPEALSEIKAIGYEGAELFAHHLAGPLGTPQSVRQEFARVNICLAGIYIDIAPKTKADIELAVARATELVPFLRAANGNRLIIGPGPRSSKGPSVEELELLCQALNLIGRQAVDTGILACFHQHVGGQVETASEFNAVVARTDGHHVFLCLDTGHLAKAGIDPYEVTEKHTRRIAQVHLKDVRENNFVQLGEGVLDNKGILEYLWKAGYSGWVVPEIPTFAPGQAAQANLRYLQSILETFQGLGK